MLIDSHSNEDNKGKIRAKLPLESFFGFLKKLKKITKRHLFWTSFENIKWKTKKNFYTTLGGNDVHVTYNSLYLYIPSLVPSPEQ